MPKRMMNVVGIRAVFSCLSVILAFASAGRAEGGAFNGGGGGDTTPDTKLSYEYAQYVEKRAYNLLPFVFQQIEFWSHPSVSLSMPDGEMKRLAPSIYKKLFGKQLVKQTVYDVLPRVNLTLLERGACVSPLGQDVDGSAATVEGQHVCLSFERLSQKLTSQSSWSNITALLAHEVSHLLGTNETEARYLQGLIEATVTFHQTFSNFDDATNRLQNQLAELRSSITEEQALITTIDERTLQCMGIQKIVDSVQALQGRQVTNTQAGISLLSVSDQYAVLALLYEATSLKFFCTKSRRDRLPYDKAFSAQKSISVATFVESLVGSAGNRIKPEMFSSNVQVWHVEFGDTIALTSQLSTMLSQQNLLKKTAQQIKPIF